MTHRITHIAKQLAAKMTKIPTDIHLYTLNTPNGVKVSMLLEELNLEYKVGWLSTVQSRRWL